MFQKIFKIFINKIIYNIIYMPGLNSRSIINKVLLKKNIQKKINLKKLTNLLI